MSREERTKEQEHACLLQGYSHGKILLSIVHGTTES